MKKTAPLTKSQIDALAKYCKEKNRTLTLFLFVDMGFTSKYHEMVRDLGKEERAFWKAIANNPELVNSYAVQDGYLLAGAQEFEKKTSERRVTKDKVRYTYHYYANVVDMEKVGTTSEKKEIVSRCEGKSDWADIQIFAFQKG